MSAGGKGAGMGAVLASERCRDVHPNHMRAYEHSTGTAIPCDSCRTWATRVTAALEAAGYGDLAQARAEALNEAANDVRRIRDEGLHPGEIYGPTSASFEQWLRDRATAQQSHSGGTP